jgi:hypothetical protein
VINSDFVIRLRGCGEGVVDLLMTNNRGYKTETTMIPMLNINGLWIRLIGSGPEQR